MRFVAPSAILLAIWYILSGKLDLLHFGTGVVAALTIGVLFSGWKDGKRFSIVGFALYLPWIIWQVLLSNLRVARLVLTPGMPIRPAFITQAPGVSGARALTTLGASITLTPGTLTVDVDEEEIFVHALDTRSAADVRAGGGARQVGRIFRERA